MECLSDNPSLAYWQNVSSLFNETLPWCEEDSDCYQYGLALLHPDEKPSYQLRLLCKRRDAPESLVNNSLVLDQCQFVRPPRRMCVCNEFQALSGPDCQQDTIAALPQTILIVVSFLYGMFALVSIQRQLNAASSLSRNKTVLVRGCQVLVVSVLLCSIYAVIELHFMSVREANYDAFVTFMFLTTLLWLGSFAFVGLFYVIQILEVILITFDARNNPPQKAGLVSRSMTGFLKSIARAKTISVTVALLMSCGYTVAIVNNDLKLIWVLGIGCVSFAIACHIYVPLLFTRRIRQFTTSASHPSAVINDTTTTQLQQLCRNINKGFRRQLLVLFIVVGAACVTTFGRDAYIGMIGYHVCRMFGIHYGRDVSLHMLSFNKVSPKVSTIKSVVSSSCGTLNGYEAARPKIRDALI